MNGAKSPSRPPFGALWKKIVFRAGAVLLGLAPLAAAEVVLQVLDVGRPTEYDDPFVGFSDVHPLFVLNEETGRYEIPPSRQSHFQPESFAAQKSRDELRIFVLGGSTVQGRPWGIETSFTTWLELNLQAAEPSRRVEVVNCGGVSYASYRLVPILQEVLAYEPDLVIFCEGHNEFLEDRTYRAFKTASPLVAWPQRQAARLRTYTLLRQAVLQLAGHPQNAAAQDRDMLGPEADARLDWKGGLAMYHRDPAWQSAVLSHFELSLRRIVEICRRADVPLLLVSPVSNLQWAPFKSEHRRGLSASELAEFDSLLSQAKELYGSDMPRALALLRRAAEIDDEHALVHYEIGICLREMGLHDQAREALVKAKELDVCPLRMLAPMKRALAEVARDTGTLLVDGDAVIAAECRSGYPDSQWLVDHVHPTIEGHQLIADAIGQKLADLGIVRPAVGGAEARKRAYEAHLASLPPAYFEWGKRRLRAEQGWARGLVTRERTGDQRRELSAHSP